MAERERDWGSGCGCGAGIDRRTFLRVAGISPLALLTTPATAMAGPFEASEFEKQVPAEKKLTPEWIASLTERGTPQYYRGAELEKIGMPVGGLCAGQLYLGGDGKLWHWDLFNQHLGTGDANYAHPPQPSSPLEQGFAVQVIADGKTEVRTLDRSGFSEIRFRGEYPIGRVEFRDPLASVEVMLEAYSPFVPLNTEDSSLPATLLEYTVKNTGKHAAEVTVVGWLENAVCLHNRGVSATRRNRVRHETGFTLLDCAAELSKERPQSPRPEILVEDWHRDTYEGWTVEGDAFGKGPIRKKEIPSYQGDVGGDTERVVNSHATAPGGDVGAKDSRTGRLTSASFRIERHFLRFWIGGGGHAGRTCMNLIVDGRIARTATGHNDNRMSLESWDVRTLEGKPARLEIVDAEKGAWGNIGVGKIVQTDVAGAGGSPTELPDWGTMGLALLGEPAEHAMAASDHGGLAGRGGEDASAPLAERLIGSLGRKLHLKPGQSRRVVFALVWSFPNLSLEGLGKVGRHYAGRWTDAAATARYVAEQHERLARETRLWRDTWYDSTLPYWFLDRTLLTTSVLATSTCYRFRDGRFYAWEGVGCCVGTCTHVWHYAHGPARLFPELERDTRERVDLGVALNRETGVMGFRAEFDRNLAVDGQAGTILRCYREHQMSSDDAFLKRNWPRIRNAFEPLLALDGNDDGVLEGAQMNTLDQPWFGKVSWLSSLYLAALCAGEAMAAEVGETAFAVRCREIVARGATNLDRELFNGEYYVQAPDTKRPHTVGSYDGCEIDQVFGDSWARQVGLPPVLPREHVKRALGSLWKYNFAPDVGPFRAAHKAGRWYAMPGEAGLLMCSWPKGESARVAQGFDFYFNECMTGFEYQVAGHMLAEGMAQEGLAITRAVYDRYHAARRNPWNEVECGDHYARSMASYGVFLAACGYEHHGPKGHLGFAPRLSPAAFRAPFTTAEGWGTYSQKIAGKKLTAEVALRWGKLRLSTLAFELPEGADPAKLRVERDGHVVPASATVATGRRVTLSLRDALVLTPGQTLFMHIG